MSEFLNRMKALAKADKKTIVLPEGEDPRTIEAAKAIVAEGLAEIVILGDPAQIDVPGATVIDPATSDKRQAYADTFYELRKAKGMTPEKAYEQVADATYYGTMMVKLGDADGLVSGACHSTANTLRPALQILKTAPGTKLVSSFFIMCTPATEYGEGGTLLFADCGLNIAPDADQLSEIAISSAATWKSLMSDEPVVAMLSYSTMGSAGGATAELVQEATRLAKEKAPELALDGDLQLDALATSATSWSSALPRPRPTARCSRASPSRSTTSPAAAPPRISWASSPSPLSRRRWHSNRHIASLSAPGFLR